MRWQGKVPSSGGGNSSTIEWLGAYNGGKGVIAQITGNTATNFEIFAGSATQAVAALLDMSESRLTPAEADQLATLIDRAKREGK